MAHIFGKKNGERGLLHLAASDESGLYDLSDTNLLTRQLANLLTRRPVDSLTSPWGHKKRSGTREGARPEWSYSIDMRYIKLIRALDQQLREPYQLHCFRT